MIVKVWKNFIINLKTLWYNIKDNFQIKRVKIVKKRIAHEEILELYKKWQTPIHVQGHCKAVSDVAVRLASELNKHGYNLDITLIERTGLVHDVARIYDDHARKGYEILSELGFLDEAEIVRVHMMYHIYNHVDKLNECDMICLADVLVIEDKYVGLDKRIEYIYNKAKKRDPEKAKIIFLEKADIELTIEDICKVIGKSFDELFEDLR